MIKQLEPFQGFSAEVFSFFEGLSANNSKAYFDKHRAVYDDKIISPAKSFITDIAPFFGALSPDIRTEPKFNQTIMRLNRDMRFAKGEPYKTFLLVHFGRFKMDSEFYLYIDKESFSIGLFINGSKGEQLLWRNNKVEYAKEIAALAQRPALEGKFTLSTFAKGPSVLKNKFSFAKHLPEMMKLDFILFEKTFKPTAKAFYNADLLTTAISTFGTVFPLYCFAVYPDPLRKIKEFDSNFSF